jgi:hypothetical protein
VNRFTDSGEYDPTFTAPPFWGVFGGISVQTIALQADQKILIGGKFNVGDVNYNNLARLNSDGSLDHTFDTGSGIRGNVRTMQVQGDGRIIIAGMSHQSMGSPVGTSFASSATSQ